MLCQAVLSLNLQNHDWARCRKTLMAAYLKIFLMCLEMFLITRVLLAVFYESVITKYKSFANMSGKADDDQ